MSDFIICRECYDKYWRMADDEPKYSALEKLAGPNRININHYTDNLCFICKRKCRECLEGGRKDARSEKTSD